MNTLVFGCKRLFYLVSYIFYVVCAVDADTTQSGSPTLTTAYSDGGYCLNPWERHAQSCYLFTTGNNTFEEAKTHCMDQGAHLVSISDDAENGFITARRRSTDKAWIGLKRQSSCAILTSCDWMWLDGSQLGYYNWQSDTLPSASLCAFIGQHGFWGNSIRCAAEREFICERKVLYPTTTPEVTTMMITRGIAGPSSTNSILLVAVMKTRRRLNDDGDSAIIIGCVVGGLVFIAIIVAVIVALYKAHRTSSRTEHPAEVKDEETPRGAPNEGYTRGPQCYEDAVIKETTVDSKQEPADSDTNAHGGGCNIYAEPIRKTDRPGSGSLTIQENTLYGFSK